MSVRKTHEALREIAALLSRNQDVSALTQLEENRSKVILLGAASEFEVLLCDVVRDFARAKSSDNALVLSLIEKKAIKRQYHTWFAWDSGNANTFFGLFGDDFSKHMKKKVIDDEEFKKSVDSFIEIGQYRNSLIHGNFLTANFPKTAEEVFDSYQLATKFVIHIKHELEVFESPYEAEPDQ